jgi:hypothetical protein
MCYNGKNVYGQRKSTLNTRNRTETHPKNHVEFGEFSEFNDTWRGQVLTSRFAFFDPEATGIDMEPRSQSRKNVLKRFSGVVVVMILPT